MYSVVLVTCPIDAAEKIAKKVLKERAAACVNIISGVESLFWWKGRIEESREALLLMKTRTELLSRLEQTVKSVHPYDLPEIIAIPITHGNKAYLDWVGKESRVRPGSRRKTQSVHAERI